MDARSKKENAQESDRWSWVAPFFVKQFLEKDYSRSRDNDHRDISPSEHANNKQYGNSLWEFLLSDLTSVRRTRYDKIGLLKQERQVKEVNDIVHYLSFAIIISVRASTMVKKKRIADRCWFL